MVSSKDVQLRKICEHLGEPWIEDYSIRSSDNVRMNFCQGPLASVKIPEGLRFKGGTMSAYMEKVWFPEIRRRFGANIAESCFTKASNTCLKGKPTVTGCKYICTVIFQVLSLERRLQAAEQTIQNNHQNLVNRIEAIENQTQRRRVLVRRRTFEEQGTRLEEQVSTLEENVNILNSGMEKQLQSINAKLSKKIDILNRRTSVMAAVLGAFVFVYYILPMLQIAVKYTVTTLVPAMCVLYYDNMQPVLQSAYHDYVYPSITWALTEGQNMYHNHMYPSIIWALTEGETHMWMPLRDWLTANLSWYMSS